MCQYNFVNFEDATTQPARCCRTGHQAGRRWPMILIENLLVAALASLVAGLMALMCIAVIGGGTKRKRIRP